MNRVSTEKTALLADRLESAQPLIFSNHGRLPLFWRAVTICATSLGALLLLAMAAVPFLDSLPGGASRFSSSATSAIGLPGMLRRQAPVRFLNVGDWGRNGNYNQSLIAEQMGVVGAAMNSQFVISNGDNFYDTGLTGTDDPRFSSSFSDVYTDPSLMTQWYAILGNHDYYGNVLSQLSPEITARDPRWFCKRSFKLSRPLCHQGTTCKETVDFFFLDTVPLVKGYRGTGGEHTLDWRGIDTSDWDYYNKKQLQELAGNLAESHARWKIVVGHHPIYSFGSHGNQEELIQHVKPILERYGADMWINGHDHNMQHIKRDDSSVHFFTSGGGSKAFKTPPPDPEDATGLQYFWEGQGFAAIQVDKTYLKIGYYGVYGNMMYSYTLTK